MNAEPTQILPQNFYVLLTEKEWALLEKAAAKDGKKNIRRLITSEMYRLHQKLGDATGDCSQKAKKRKNYYKIPEELRPFFKYLSCNFGVDVSVVMFRLVVLPHLINQMSPQEKKEVA